MLQICQNKIKEIFEPKLTGGILKFTNISQIFTYEENLARICVKFRHQLLNGRNFEQIPSYVLFSIAK